jgi:WD40 repeat protein
MKNNFLLSTSMDRTVRLWHVSRAECLCCFKHSDFVTSIQFHPRDDRFFLAGSLDSKLRLWSIPDKSVAFWATVPDMVTAVAFTPDGKHSIAGCLNGLCILYETDGLKANAQVHVRSARGRNAKGSKITGIDTIWQPSNDPNGDVKLLITSNDSRIRLYNFKDRNLEAKYRGNENSTSQIRASFSDDGKHIICGSEDRRVYIWPTGSADKEPDKRAVEELETRTAIVTSAIMAPATTKQLLGFSGDPLYDLCNPPPITLVSQAESLRSSKAAEKGDGPAARRHEVVKAQGSPAYLARSTHPDGNIIIAADYNGRIKVFRQDCAYHQRPMEFWDGSSTFSRKLLGRSNSARHSIASSIGKTPSERILAWRSSVTGTELASNSARSGRTRSMSPRKSLGRQSRYSSAVQSPITTKTESGHATPRSRSSVSSHGSDEAGSKPGVTVESEAPSAFILQDAEPSTPPTFFESGQSNAFWSKAHQMAKTAKSHQYLDPNDLVPARRHSSVASALSSDLSSPSNEADEDDVLRCPRCRGTNFRASKTRAGRQRLVCTKCNTVVKS